MRNYWQLLIPCFLIITAYLLQSSALIWPDSSVLTDNRTLEGCGKPNNTPDNFDIKWETVSSFIGDLTFELGIREIFLCMALEPDIIATFNRKLNKILLKEFTHVHQCDLHVIEANAERIKNSKFHDANFHQPLTSAVLILSSSRYLSDSMKLVTDLHEFSMGALHHIVVGVDLPECSMLEPGPRFWMQASLIPSAQIVILKEFYMFSDSVTPVYNTFGHWKSRGDLVIYETPGYGPKHFEWHTLRAVALPLMPQIIEGKLNENPIHNHEKITEGDYHRLEGGQDRYLKGYLISVLNSLAETLNFRISLSLPSPRDFEVGALYSNGSFSGLVGLLQRKDVDIALTTFTATQERSRVMDFSFPIGFSGLSLYIHSNKIQDSVGWTAFVVSFRWTTWLGIIGLSIATGVTLWILVNNSKYSEMADYTSFSWNMLTVLSCLTHQGIPKIPKCMKAKVIFLIFSFTSLVLYSSYTARLVSFLTVSSGHLPFKSLREAIRNPEWNVGILRGTAIPTQLQQSHHTDHNQLYEELYMNPTLFVASDEEALQRMENSNFAYFHDNSIMFYLMTSSCKTNLRKIPGNSMAGFVHLGYMKNLPYAKAIDAALAKMDSTGVLYRMRKKWWHNEIYCEDGSKFQELGLRNVATAPLLLGIGIAVSLVIMFLEIMHRLWLTAKFSKIRANSEGRQSSFNDFKQQFRLY